MKRGVPKRVRTSAFGPLLNPLFCRADLEQAEKAYAISQGKDKHVADTLCALAGPFKI